MKLVLPYPPTQNLIWRMWRNRMVKTPEAKRYHATVGNIARASGMACIVSGPVAVRVEAYRPRRIGDLDNTLKVTLDALKGIAWTDDSQVTEILARRFDDKERPRLEISVMAIDRTVTP